MKSRRVFSLGQISRAVAFAAVSGALVFGSAAADEPISAVNAQQLEEVLTQAGLSPTMLADATSGAPVANGRAGDISFFVRGLSCSGTPAACSNLVFFANFALGRAATAGDFRTVNGFNDGQVFGRAYVLDKSDQVGVDYVIELDGGVTRSHLTQNVSRWADVIAAFVDTFSKGEPAS